jgi:hypothetical protein
MSGVYPAVSLERECHTGVPGPLPDDLRVDALVHQRCALQVPQVMHADRRYPGARTQRLQVPLLRIVPVQRLAVGLTEDQIQIQFVPLRAVLLPTLRSGLAGPTT